jgi:TolB-like protein/tRNA A-37 threonylcarbamoyl transferase component Bud32
VSRNQVTPTLTSEISVGPRYRIERPLGEGGMGLVFEAVDVELKRRVAIKLIRYEREDDEARARFMREARAAAALTHPNACQLYEVSEHEGQPFLVLELLDGEPLSARLAREPIPLGELAGLMLPLMDVVAAFHREGLVHRDLKPSNIFLTSRGVKLLDFGLARRVDRGDAVTTTLLTSPGAVTGTMRYMAPEQITGDPIDARADVFALGVLMYEMLTGRIPFDAETNIEWLNAVLKDDPPPLGDPSLQHLDPIVTRALQRRPQDRYASVDQMRREFEIALQPGGGARDSTRGNGRSGEPEGAREAGVPSNGVAHGVAKSSAATAATEPAVWRLAVLPFRVPSDDTELEPLEHGVPEALTATLAQSHGWRVISNRMAQPHADSPDLMAAGKALEVDRLLTGTLLRADDDLRVTVQLIDAADGAVLWSATNSHRWTSAVAMQDIICGQIASELASGDV